eukprot:6599494-Alexandrium_andersonii.AAC.1
MLPPPQGATRGCTQFEWEACLGLYASPAYPALTPDGLLFTTCYHEKSSAQSLLDAHPQAEPRPQAPVRPRHMPKGSEPVSYTHLRAHETSAHL